MKWLSHILTVLLLCVAIPVLFSVGSAVEGRVWPVTSRAAVSNETQVGQGLSFYAAFDKHRQCEFRGLSWYQGAERLVLDFEPSAEQSPLTRPTGEQFVGP